MIEVQGISKRFGDITALSDVSFTVEKGQIVGFLGANGAGKTTTMDILCGCIGADSGTSKVAGFEIGENPREVKRRLGYLPDEPPLHLDMRVQDFIVYAAKLREVPSSDISRRVESIIDRLTLGDVRKRLVGNLSKGFRQRVGLAQALVHNPDVLILDEPTEGLDPNQIVQIRELIRSLREDHTIIFSSHILAEVENISDRVVIINKGKVVEQGNYQDLVGRLESGRRYFLRTGHGAEALASLLHGMPGVNSLELVDSKDNVIEFNANGDAGVLDQIARKVLDGNFGLRELALKSRSLEDVFFQLTKSN